MNNYEVYKELLDMMTICGRVFAVDKSTNALGFCSDEVQCVDCLFYDGDDSVTSCYTKRFNWLHSEYTEPASKPTCQMCIFCHNVDGLEDMGVCSIANEIRNKYKDKVCDQFDSKH